jgi:hypothetical protein
MLIFFSRMVELHIILAIFLLCLLSFFEIIVFNEEILLTLCFLSFLFYCFNTLSDSILSSFEARAAKFEDDLLLSFSTTKLSLINDFNTYNKLQSFTNQFTILMFSLTKFLSQCETFLKYKPSWIYYQACLTKFNELVLTNKNFINVFQKACVTHLLYSLILNKSTNDLTFLMRAPKVSSKLSVLKTMCL